MAIRAEGLDVQQTSIGGEADRPQGGQVVQPLADGEVAGVVDRGLGAQRPSFLVVLFDPAVLVVDVQRGLHPLRQHPGAEAARRPFAHAPVEDELHVVGPA